MNDSEVEHTATGCEEGIPGRADYFASGGFDSERVARNDPGGGLLAAGETHEHTFDVRGTYGYVCVPHEGSGMTGAVVVG